MASYLFPYQPVQIEPYKTPVELYASALQYKNTRFAQGLANIRSHYDAVLNTPLTNEEDQQIVRAGLNTAMQRLSKTAISDLSLPENQAEINSVFDSILDDSDIMYDAAWTRRHNRELRRAEELQKSKPELVPPQNLEPMYLASEEFRQAPKGSRPRPTTFTPYYDYDTKMRDVLDKTKADVDLMFSKETTTVEGPDGQMHSVSLDGQYTVEQLKDYTIDKIVHQRLASDPQAMFQLDLDYKYNTRNGFYPAGNAISEINNDLSGYKSMDTAIQKSLDSGLDINNKPLTANDRTILEEQKKGVTAEMQRLNTLKGSIQVDPTKANEYFTFGKHISKYVGSLKEQYGYTKTSLISDIPSVAALQKHRYDVWNRQWDHMYDVDLEGVKSANKIREEAAKAKAEVESIQAPLVGMATKLDASMTGSINIDRAETAALIDAEFDKNTGDMWKTWTGDGLKPQTSLIAVPGSGTFSKDQLRAVNQNTVFAMMNQELDALKIPGKKEPLHIYSGEGVPTNVEGFETRAQAEEILDMYGKDPNAVDKRAVEIIEKYRPLLGIDPTNKDQVDEMKKGLEDVNIRDAVTYGMTIKPTGKMKFVPDDGDNLIAGDNGLWYMKGKFVMANSQAIRHLGKNGLANGLDKGYVIDWGPVVTSGPEGEDVKKRTERNLALSVYLPVYGDKTTINDRLLKNKGYQDQWGQKAPQYRQESERQTRQFFDETVPISQSLPTGQGLIQPRAGGGYGLVGRRPMGHGGYERIPGYDEVVNLAATLSSRTGIPYNEALDGAVQALGGGRTPLQRLKLLQGFESTVGSQAPDMNSRAARNNNPLNIKDDSAGGVSATGKDDQNHAIFANPGQGLQAGLGKLQNILSGGSSKYSANSTIADFADTYAESPTDARNLIGALRNLGFTATEQTRINQIPLPTFFEAMIMKEDRKYYNYLKASGILDAFLKQL